MLTDTLKERLEQINHARRIAPDALVQIRDKNATNQVEITPVKQTAFRFCAASDKCSEQATIVLFDNVQEILKDIHQANYYWRKNDESYIPVTLDELSSHKLTIGLQSFFTEAKDQLLEFIDSMITFKNQLTDVQVPNLVWNDALMGLDAEQNNQDYLQTAQQFFYAFKENLTMFMAANTRENRESAKKFFAEIARPLESLIQNIQESMNNILKFVHRDKILEMD